MAFRATAVLQTENLRTDIGKYGGGAGKTNLPKTAKNGRQDRRPFGDLSNNRRQGRKPFADLSNTEHQNRKPLRDVSNTGKPPVSGPSKGLVLNDNSAVHARGTTKNASKGKFLTDEEEIKMCHEWAKEGIELAHFTGNDLQKLQKNVIGNGVKKKVEKVMTAVHEWADVTYDLVLPMKNEISKNITNVEKMEVEREILPNLLLPSDNKESDICETEVHIHPFLEGDVVLKMKDDDPCTTSNNDDVVLKMKDDDPCTTSNNDPGCPSACRE